MVLGSLITKLVPGLQGLLQGGGFGLGYGFGVRLGYDAYGGLKDLITKGAASARLSPSTGFTSHLGSGILTALGLTMPEASAQTTPEVGSLDAAIHEQEMAKYQALAEKYPDRQLPEGFTQL